MNKTTPNKEQNSRHGKHLPMKVYAVYTREDLILEIIAAVLLVVMWGFTVWLYHVSPEKIPVHFNAAGEANGWGGRSELFIIAGIATAISVLMFCVSRGPSTIFNYPFRVTKDNIQIQHQIAVRMIRYINIGMILIMTTSLLAMGHEAIGISTAAASAMTQIMILALFVLIALFVVKAWRYR